MGISRLVALVVAALVLVGCSDDDPATSESSPTEDLSSTAKGIEAAVHAFDDEAHEYPRTLRLRAGAVKVIGADRSSDAGDPRLRKGVTLDWYVGFPDVRRPNERGSHPVRGYAYCLSKADRYWYVTADERGTIVDGARKGACPERAAPPRATARQLDAARVRVQSSLAKYATRQGSFPRSVAGAPGAGGQGELVLGRGAMWGVTLGWYDNLALRRDPIATGNTVRSEMIPQPDAQQGAAYSLCLDNGSEWRIVVVDREGILDSEGDGVCPPLGY